jgi:hypothetical protein
MITEEDKLIRQPLFAKGCLTFKNSGHTLILDREYYRCSEQVKGNCQHHGEKMIKVKDMVKRFDNLITKFELPKGEAGRVFDELLMVMVKQWRKSSQRDVHLEEILVSTGNIIIDQIKKRQEISKTDFLEFKRTFYTLLKNQYEEMLFYYLLDPLFTLNPWKKEQDEMAAFLRKSMGINVQRIRINFSWHVRKLYLSDDGQIDSLEFENWSWYVMQYTKRHIPEFMADFKPGFIVNTRYFDTLDFFEVADEFSQNDFRDAMSYSAFATNYAKEKILHKIFDGFENLKPKAQIEYLKKLDGLTKQSFYAYFATLNRI